jgi:hypothetical protein
MNDQSSFKLLSFSSSSSYWQRDTLRYCFARVSIECECGPVRLVEQELLRELAPKRPLLLLLLFLLLLLLLLRIRLSRLKFQIKLLLFLLLVN